MKAPKLLKTAEEVNEAYALAQHDRECSGLVHQVDTSGSCQCGFFIDNKPGGSFPFVPNRRTRRMLQSYKRSRYVPTDEDKARLEVERVREEKRREERNARREDRKRAALSRRSDEDDQSSLTVSLLVGSEEGSPTDG